jgi:hypothetical protein
MRSALDAWKDGGLVWRQVQALFFLGRLGESEALHAAEATLDRYTAPRVWADYLSSL